MPKQQKRSRTRRVLPDSSTSIAGYEYQFLWAALRCLNLLSPSSRATQVVVEALYGPDIDTLLAEDEDLLVIDVSEYEGGMTLREADRIIVTQCKYSPSAPRKAWTTAGLCASRSNNPKRSIIGGLGLIFRRFWEQCQVPDKLPQKLSLRLVTNRPLQRATRITIEKAQLILCARQSERIPDMRWVLGRGSLSDADRSCLDRLRKTAGLQSRQFATFLLCLDLSGFGKPGLESLNILARQTLVGMGGSWRDDELRELLALSVRSE